MKSITTQVAEKVYLHSKKAFGIFTLTLLLFSSFLILNQNTEAQQLVCPMRDIDQITDETSGFSVRPSINADGTRIAFDSTADINGGNPEGNREIYLFDTTTRIITQITDETAGDSDAPSINADGTRIAFFSNADINGGNPEGNSEIYLAICFDPSVARPIPTLGEWGLVALAGVLGIVGLLAVRRKKVRA